MRRINGAYNYLGKEIIFDTEIPGEWSEMDPHQYATVVEIKTFSKADQYTIAVSMLTALFGPKNYNILLHLDNEQLLSCVGLTDFIYNTPLPVKNFFPKLNIKKKVCYAPSDTIGEVNFGEWCFAYQAWDNYRRYSNDQSLNELVAILYRPQSADPNSMENTGDIREPFNENTIEKHSMSAAHIDKKTKLAIYGWYTAALTEQMSYRPVAFPKTESESDQNTLEQDPQTIFTLFREILGPKWGTTNILRNENANFVLDGLEEMRISFKEANKPL